VSRLEDPQLTDDVVVDILFEDAVNVRSCRTGCIKHLGVVFGDWYIIEGTTITHTDGSMEHARNYPPGSRFLVGHNPSGRALIWGLTFWDARRVALALADADPDVNAWTLEELDAILGSSLMDHYVFPIDGWSV
jgi:hypothetical protein